MNCKFTKYHLSSMLLLVSCLSLGVTGCGGRSEPTVVTPDETVVAPEMDENYDPTGGGDVE